MHLHLACIFLQIMNMNDASCLGYDSSVAPKLDNFPYAQWCVRFKLFVQSKHFDLWEIIDDAYIVPILEKSKWNKNDHRMFTMNNILLEYLLNAFNSSMSNKFVHFDSAYTLWIFIEAHQGDLEAIRQALGDPASSSKGTSCTRPLGDSPSEVCEFETINDLPNDELACASEKLLHAFNKLQNDFINLQSKHVNPIMSF